jgi:uncharacterized membrane protein YfcA
VQFAQEFTQSMLPGLSAGMLTMLALTIFVAGLARGFSGFGAALIFIPLASALIGPKLASPVLLVIDMVAAAGLLPNAVAKANRRDVGAMTAGALLGVPAGAVLLTMADPTLVRWIISVTAAAFLLLLMSGWRYSGKPSVPVASGVGLVAGLYSGAAQLGGPPVVAYWLGGRSNPDMVRANVVLYFAISSVISAVSYAFAGLLVRDVFILALVCGPIYALGLTIGARLFGLVSDRVFRIICYGLIGFAALTSLPLFDPWIRG